MIAESGDMRRCRWILCVGGTQKDIFIAEKTDCSRIGNYDADGLRFFVYVCSRTAFWDRTATGL